MDKKRRVKYILKLVEEELDSILESESLQELAAEDCIQLALEIVTNNGYVIEPETRSPLTVSIDKRSVSFMIDDEMAIPLYGDGTVSYEEDVDDEDSL